MEVQLRHWGSITAGTLSRCRGGLAVLRALAAGGTTAGAGEAMALLAAHLDGSWLVEAVTCDAGAEGVCTQRWEDVGAGRGAMALGNAAAPNLPSSLRVVSPQGERPPHVRPLCS